jgi:hypothetical protein
MRNSGIGIDKDRLGADKLIGELLLIDTETVSKASQEMIQGDFW